MGEECMLSAPGGPQFFLEKLPRVSTRQLWGPEQAAYQVCLLGVVIINANTIVSCIDKHHVLDLWSNLSEVQL